MDIPQERKVLTDIPTTVSVHKTLTRIVEARHRVVAGLQQGGGQAFAAQHGGPGGTAAWEPAVKSDMAQCQLPSDPREMESQGC